jgi:DNA-binding response OmpR family regulator
MQSLPKENNGKPSASAIAFHVLIVEDNSDLAKLFSDLFGVMGCTSDIALNAKSGFEKALQNPPDLVFSDLRLPGDKNGFDLAKDFRMHKALSATPLVAVTGSCEPEDFVRAEKAGFDRIFTKPFKFAEIHKLLRDLQEKKAQTQSIN